jgi:hypothetical protein
MANLKEYSCAVLFIGLFSGALAGKLPEVNELAICRLRINLIAFLVLYCVMSPVIFIRLFSEALAEELAKLSDVLA